MPKRTTKIVFIFFTLFYLFSSTVLQTFAAMNYTYDADGNMSSDGSKCYTYNDENQLVQVKDCGTNQVIATYVYDYQGNRLVKKNYVNGTLSNTVYSPEDEYETKKLASNSAIENTTYYFANGQQIAKKNPDGSKLYLQNDNLGSASIVTAQNGSLVESTTYYPFGEVRSGGTKDKFQYTGQEKDSETNLNYYNSRYYNAHIRRFIQPDTVLPDVYNPQTLNRYSYVNNNPLRYTDPSGHSPALLVALLNPEVLIPAAIISALLYVFYPPVRNAVNTSVANVIHTAFTGAKVATSIATKAVTGLVNKQPTSISTNKPSNSNNTPSQNSSPKVPNMNPLGKIGPAIPPIATTVLQQIRDKGETLENYASGVYENRTVPFLPKTGEYIEHDINPLVEGVWRGTQRLVIDTISGKAWYTPDHYKTWIPFE